MAKHLTDDLEVNAGTQRLRRKRVAQIVEPESRKGVLLLDELLEVVGELVRVYRRSVTLTEYQVVILISTFKRESIFALDRTMLAKSLHDVLTNLECPARLCGLWRLESQDGHAFRAIFLYAPRDLQGLTNANPRLSKVNVLPAESA